MFSTEIRKLLIQVITSWQVLVVTIILIVYIFLVNSVARIYHRRPHQPPLPKVKPEIPEAPNPKEAEELGVEEAPKA